MKISLACLTLNLLLAAALVVPLKQGGLGIANTVTSVCNAGLLFFALRKKLGRLDMAPLRVTFLPLAVAGLLAGLVAWQGWQFWENALGHETLALKIGAVFVPAGIAGIIYLLAALACKIPAAQEMSAFALAKFKRPVFAKTKTP
jgi:peptidoglycan biosynthesis protein MviN/MurJ (putative lipid II flippase)